MGTLLISGSGKGNRAIIFLWLTTGLIVCILALGLIYYFYLEIEETDTIKHPLEDMTRYVGFIFIIILIVVSLAMHNNIVKTRINVYYGIIEGVGLINNNLICDYGLVNFKIPYGKIINTSIKSNSITIHTANIKYKCYVANASEIQTIINSRRADFHRWMARGSAGI